MIRRAVLASLALLLILAPVVDAKGKGKGRPHLLAAGDSIAVADVVFPASAEITWTVVSPYDGGLWARTDCLAEEGHIGLSQYEKLDGLTQGVPVGDFFEITVTPSWTGGNATCHTRLLVLNGYFDDVVLAETTFRVFAG